MKLAKFQQFVYVLEIWNQSQYRENLRRRCQRVPLLFHLILMHVENCQVVRDLIFDKWSELLLIEYRMDLLDYLIRWHMELLDVLFEPCVEALNPVHRLLVLEIF